MSYFAEAFSIEGLNWLLFGAALAGLVRGFTGFGTAMVFLPFASAVVSPVWALVALISMDILGPLPLLPNAIRKGHPRDIILMALGMLAMLPVGLLVLTRLESDVYRYVVSIATLGCIGLIVSGVRYKGVLTKKLIVVTGGIGGLLGGLAGVPGPPVMVLYFASQLPAQTIRANLILFLFLADIMLFPILGLQGFLSLSPILIGFICLLPYFVGSMIGAYLFDPERENIYRGFAICVIVVSALIGLPFWYA